jgi:hypothetical protein
MESRSLAYGPPRSGITEEGTHGYLDISSAEGEKLPHVNADVTIVKSYRIKKGILGSCGTHAGNPVSKNSSATGAVQSQCNTTSAWPRRWVQHDAPLWFKINPACTW